MAIHVPSLTSVLKNNVINTAPGPYGPPVMMPRRPPSVELRDDTMDYADQLRKRQMYPGGPPVSHLKVIPSIFFLLVLFHGKFNLLRHPSLLMQMCYLVLMKLLEKVINFIFDQIQVKFSKEI